MAQQLQPLILPPAPPGGSRLTLSDVGTAPTPQYSLYPQDKPGHIIKLETLESDSLGHVMIHIDVPNSFCETMNSPEREKWCKASEEEFKGLTKMGIWKLVQRPKDHKMIKCRWTYVVKSDG